MKDFFSTFLICVVACWIFVFFFLGIILENLWLLIFFIAFVMAAFITIIIKQETRIEELEKKVEKVLRDREEITESQE